METLNQNQSEFVLKAAADLKDRLEIRLGHRMSDSFLIAIIEESFKYLVESWDAKTTFSKEKGWHVVRSRDKEF